MFSFDRQSLGRSIASLSEYPELVAAYAIYKTLTVFFLFCTPPLPELIPSFAGAIATPYAFYCFAIAVWCVLFALFGRNSHVFERVWYLWVTAGILILGIILLLIAFFLESALGQAGEFFVWRIGIFMATGGYAAIHIEFGRLMGYLGMTYTLIINVGCLLISLPLLGLMLLLPLPMQVGVSLFSIIVGVAFLYRAFGKEEREEVFRPTEESLSIPIRFMVTSFAQGVSVGLLFTVFSCSSIEGFWGEAIASVVAAVAALLFGLTFRVSFDRLIYRIGFALIGIGCTIWAVADGSLFLHQLSSFLQLCAYIYLDIILWSLGSHLIKDRNQPALWVASCPSASLLTGRCLGSMLGTYAMSVPLFDISSITPDVFIATLSVCGFLLIALELTSSSNIENGWGFIRLSENPALSSRISACALIAGDFHLTEREHEILTLLAQGKNRKEIAEELFVTVNTVKTHQRNLYAKLDVHSFEELCKFIDHQEGSFKSHS